MFEAALIDHGRIEEIISEFPVCEFGFLNPDEIIYTERTQIICRQECPRYNRSWSCPPATGSWESCEEKCRSYREVLLITTLAEVNDIANLEETLSTREEHQEVVRGIMERIREMGLEVLALSGESCDRCEKCAWPDGPCRHPEYMIPCIEGYGIVATEAAEKCGIAFYTDAHTVTWFAMLFIR